jgi:Ino eighty subunit 2
LAAKASAQQIQKSKYAEYGESDIEDEEDRDEDEDEDEDEEDDDEDDGQEEEEPNDFDQLGAEPEGGTDDEDVDMKDAPPPVRHTPPKPPKITLKPPAKEDAKHGIKAQLIVTPANVGPVKSVEDQEMEDDPDDDEVEDSSELSEDEDEDEEDQTNLNEDDAEGEDDEIEVGGEAAPGEEDAIEEGDEEEDDDDSDESRESGSATPDMTKLTKRQRGRPEDQGGLMALDMAPQQRKVCPLTTSTIGSHLTHTHSSSPMPKRP